MYPDGSDQQHTRYAPTQSLAAVELELRTTRADLRDLEPTTDPMLPSCERLRKDVRSRVHRVSVLRDGIVRLIGGA